jgi:stage V sporulation protein S
MNEFAATHHTNSGSHPALYSREEGKKRTGPDIIKVSAQSRSTSVAGAIAGVVRETRRAEVQAYGAGAVNQAIKASAIARGYLLLDGIDVVIIPSFSDVDIEGAERTAVRLTIEPR